MVDVCVFVYACVSGMCTHLCRSMCVCVCVCLSVNVWPALWPRASLEQEDTGATPPPPSIENWRRERLATRACHSGHVTREDSAFLSGLKSWGR